MCLLIKIIRGILTIVGMSLGFGIATLMELVGLFNFLNNTNTILYIDMGVSLIFGIIFFFISPKIIKTSKKIANRAENELQNVPTGEIVVGSAGLIIGLLIATLVSQPFYKSEIPYVGTVISVVLYLLFGYLGIKIPTRKREDFSNIINVFKLSSGKEKNTKEKSGFYPKVLDTSVIIDGRIADICRTGFLEGPLVIPEFVLDELRHIADSSDGLKRNRGRRGLDILNMIQKELSVEVQISAEDFENIKEVDKKLLKLAEVMNGKVVTNDFNLNKVAEFHGVDVLNINELANAVKPVVLPGEEMIVLVVKDGKESGQGVAYLDDGTMIVVDGGKKHMGRTIEVVVTSVLQTTAGRMIFAKSKTMTNKAV